MAEQTELLGEKPRSALGPPQFARGLVWNWTRAPKKKCP